MNTELVKILKNNAIAVVATDTLYGILGRTDNEAVVQRIYTLKGRDEYKPFIILVPTVEALADFGVVLSEYEKELLAQWWPGAVTVIIPIAEDKRDTLAYLHRGTNELAFRLPAKPSLLQLVKETGPLVAPSTNPQGQEPAYTIAEAKAYFGTAVDHYEDEGEVHGRASTIVRLNKGHIEIIRQGTVLIFDNAQD
jgi:L-threonylcarbamoyladenylate synthase